VCTGITVQTLTGRKWQLVVMLVVACVIRVLDDPACVGHS